MVIKNIAIAPRGDGSDKGWFLGKGECLLLLNTLQAAYEAGAVERQQKAYASVVRYLLGRGVLKALPGSEVDSEDIRKKIAGCL